MERKGTLFQGWTLSMSPLLGYCNNECAHCAYNSGPKRERIEVDLEVAKRIVDQAGELDFVSIVFSGGGEPTKYSNFEELVRYAAGVRDRSKSLRSISVTTNGWFITGDKNETVENFRRYHDMGINFMTISDSEYHREFNSNLGSFNNYHHEIKFPKVIVSRIHGEYDLQGLGRAKTKLGVKKTCCDGLYFDGYRDALYVFPDGYYACCYHRMKLDDLDLPVSDAIDRLENDVLMRVAANANNRMRTILINRYPLIQAELIKNEYGSGYFDDLLNGPCPSCTRLTSNSEFLRILRESFGQTA